MTLNPFLCIDLSISDSLRSVRKSVLIYETIILPGSKINGATKKMGKNIMLMVNDRRLYSDTFCFTLLHEIGHIINKDYGISFEKETGEQE